MEAGPAPGSASGADRPADVRAASGSVRGAGIRAAQVTDGHAASGALVSGSEPGLPTTHAASPIS